MFRYDQTWNGTGRPPHGLVAYMKDAKNVLEQTFI